MESYAIIENEYRNIKKMVDGFGGESQIKLSFSKVEILDKKNDELE